MADVTAPQFQQDVNKSAEWANGDENTTVTMRLGQQARSPAKVINDIQQQADTAILAAANNFNLSPSGFDFATGGTLTSNNQTIEDASGNNWIYTLEIPEGGYIVSAGTIPTNPPYKQVAYGTAAQVSTNTSDTVQTFIDSLSLEIFQSPTDGLTKIKTRTLLGGEVYEVRKVSDDSLATIYSNAAGTIEIVQDGDDNKSGSDGVVEFFLANSSYYITVNSVRSYFKIITTASDVAEDRSINVQTRLNELSSTSYGVFKSPANLGHVIGGFLYKKISPTDAELVTDISHHYPAGYDCTIEDYEEKGLKAYFVEQGSTGTGDTLVDPMGSIADAIAKPDVDVIFVKKGVYGIRSNFNASTPLRDVIIKSLYGQSTITTIDENGVWSDNLDGTYTHTLPSGSVNEVYDLEDAVSVDDLGYLVKLPLAATLLECQETEGTWFRDGSTAVVHRRTPTAPTNSTVYCLRSSPIGFRDFSTKVYFEGFITFGGQNGGMTIDNATGVYKGINNDYLYGTGSSGDSFNARGSYLVINENCKVAAGEKDGLNYHDNVSRRTDAIEINCTGIGNRTFGTGNGSTGHEDCRIIRLGCNYAFNNGPGVADIQEVKSLNVCCTSNNNRNDPNSKGFLFTETVETWCDGITSVQNRTADIETQGDSVMHIRYANYGSYNELSSVIYDSDFL